MYFVKEARERSGKFLWLNIQNVGVGTKLKDSPNKYYLQTFRHPPEMLRSTFFYQYNKSHYNTWRVVPKTLQTSAWNKEQSNNKCEKITSGSRILNKYSKKSLWQNTMPCLRHISVWEMFDGQQKDSDFSHNADLYKQQKGGIKGQLLQMGCSLQTNGYRHRGGWKGAEVGGCVRCGCCSWKRRRNMSCWFPDRPSLDHVWLAQTTAHHKLNVNDCAVIAVWSWSKSCSFYFLFPAF